MEKTVTIFYHAKREGPGKFRTIFEERSYHQQLIFTPREDIMHFDALAPDLLVVMGGSMGVYEADRYPFLKAEIEILKRRLAADYPTLGICLGSQLMAKALGREIFKGKPGKEIGWAPLTLTAAGEKHPVRHIGGEHALAFHWHGDTYELPEGATLLASSANYTNQAYSFGKNALALQFHPEVGREQIDEWLTEGEKELAQSILCKDLEKIRAISAENVNIMNRQSCLMLEEWLKCVGL